MDRSQSSNTTKNTIVKGAIQRDFDDLILASPISKMFGDKSFFSYFSKPKHGLILHKNDCERNYITW